MKNIDEMSELEKIINDLDPRIDRIAEAARKALEECRAEEKDDEELDDEYLREHFNILMLTLEFGLSADDVRNILLEKYPADSPKRKLLIEYMNSNDLKERMLYPGGYDGFVEDYNNGVYRGILE